HRLHETVRAPDDGEKPPAAAESEDNCRGDGGKYAKEKQRPSADKVSGDAVHNLPDGVEEHSDREDAAQLDLIETKFFRIDDGEVRPADVVPGVADEKRGERDDVPAPKTRSGSRQTSGSLASSATVSRVPAHSYDLRG